MEDFTMTKLKFLKLSYFANTCEGLRHKVVAGNLRAHGGPFNLVKVQSSMRTFFPEVHKSPLAMVRVSSQKPSRIICHFFYLQAESYTFLNSLSWFELLPDWPPGVLTKDPVRGTHLKVLAYFSSGDLLISVHILSRIIHPQQASHFDKNYKIASKSLHGFGLAEPLICKGLLTTTRAKIHRPPDKHYNIAMGEQLVTHTRRSMHMGLRGGFPDRNSESSLIGVGFAPGLRTLYDAPPGTIQTKAVPKPLYNWDITWPLFREDLFTTTRAKKHRPPDKHYNIAAGEQLATHTRRSMHMGLRAGLPDRNSESSLIGIGLAPGLRTIYNSPPKTIQSKAHSRPLLNYSIARSFTCKVLPITTRKKKYRVPVMLAKNTKGVHLAADARTSISEEISWSATGHSSVAGLSGISQVPSRCTNFL